MAYAGSPTVSARVPGIGTNKDGAKGFASRLVMYVFVVLESQGRSVLLPDAVIQPFWISLVVNITYEPLLCQNVILNRAMDMMPMMASGCIIIGNTGKRICSNMSDREQLCMPVPMVTITSVPSSHTSFSGFIMV
ncbi:hypothetical protein KIN20_014514 [Parelaphostrongylus tenuis]|uniref:Uncharacterized protein n=1 Tax=Parelaphostrongylus tenuis TaxID=148309 RepID=A0AAD5MXF9_PARTN|nr:hypothetical protein KIN20_014514 [Parelaphostrongylus tenuis]